MCRHARPIFREETMASNVPSLLAETLLKMVLTHLRNVEIVRTYEKNSKGRHETEHILRYVPQADNSSNMIKTAEVLRFVKDQQVNTLSGNSKVRKGEPRHARGSSHHTCVKTVASTCDMNTVHTTPNRTNGNRREFDMIKSHEKEALFLSDRFGDRRETFRTVDGLDRSLISALNDPGFAPEVLHLSKGKID